MLRGWMLCWWHGCPPARDRGSITTVSVVGEEQQPWQLYFGANAARLLAVEEQYNPERRVNGLLVQR